MQERRTTVRIGIRSNAQYCPGDDLLPRDGRIANVSERGAGVQTRETHGVGERMTVSVRLPGESEAATATGVIRWAADRPSSGGWYPLGMEWLPLEEGARSRLHRFFSSHAYAAQAPQRPARGAATQPSVRLWWIAGALACVGLAVAWQVIQGLQRQAGALGQEIEHRDAVIGFMRRREATLQDDLAGMKRRLSESAEEMSRLGDHARALGTEVARLNTVLAQAEGSFAHVSAVRDALVADRAALVADRDALMKRMMDMEQERMALARRLVNPQQVKRLANEVISERRAALAEALRQARLAAEAAEPGNAGFVVREGRPTVGQGTLWIRVHQPEAGAAAPAVDVTEAAAAAP